MLSKKFYIGPSQIHGDGVIANCQIFPGESIGEGIIFIWSFVPVITDHLGVWINHCYKPNANLQWINNAWHIVANQTIYPHQEITTNYANTPWYIDKPRFYYK